MELVRQALALLPPRLLDAGREETPSGLEEIRLRTGSPPFGIAGGLEIPLSSATVHSEDLDRILERATGASIHTSIDALRSGYFTIHGLRIGVCGTLIQEGKKIEGFRHISSLAIRIPKECRGICDPVIKQLYSLGSQNTLVVSPPGGGKTTVLREMIRCLSEHGYRLSVADERNEISGTEKGTARFDLGPHTDVIAGGEKAESVMMLLRTMNPQILAMDEISEEKDCALVRSIIGSGVGILATAHASGTEDLQKRPLYRCLLDEQAFAWAITIRQCGSKRSLHSERLMPCAC